MEGARLGQQMAVGDVDGDGVDELAVGLYDYPAAAGGSLGLPVASGVVLLIRSGVLFGDGFESGDTAAWSSKAL